MTTCTEVKEAEELTGHSHSLRVTTQSNEHYYFKADTSDEIKWWVNYFFWNFPRCQCVKCKKCCARPMNAPRNEACKRVRRTCWRRSRNGSFPLCRPNTGIVRMEMRTSSSLSSTDAVCTFFERTAAAIRCNCRKYDGRVLGPVCCRADGRQNRRESTCRFLDGVELVGVCILKSPQRTRNEMLFLQFNFNFTLILWF